MISISVFDGDLGFPHTAKSVENRDSALGTRWQGAAVAKA